ncbi:amidohydrolase [Novosphingobium sp.]|uniref:amidohydrolase n=1 Tax=Novosphingobium sp. TaxID=1874826 RepID=UPI00263490F9|nr:amidohydrolase [Novosphingobium sp.]
MRTERMWGMGAALALVLVLSGKVEAKGVIPADLVILNGKIVTVDSRSRVVRAVAVRGSRIVAVGDVRRYRGRGTRVIDLKGRTMLPGFIDAHSHVGGMAEVEAHTVDIQVPPLKDGAAVIARLKEKAAHLPPGAWLIGNGTYNQPMPTRQALDAAFPEHPVDLRWSAHDHLINHKAAQIMGLDRSFPDPPAGSAARFERTADGEIAIIRDAEVPWPKDMIPAFTAPERKEAVRAILDDFYLKRGVTMVSDMSDIPSYTAMAELRAEGRLPTRVRMNFLIGPLMHAGITVASSKVPDPVGRIEAMGYTPGGGTEWLKVGAIKFIQDGVWGTTSAVYRPHWKGSATTWKPDNVGGVTYGQDELNTLVGDAYRRGWQVQIHANGDRSQDMVLDAYEAAQARWPRADARLRIEHFAHFLSLDPQRTERRLQRMVADHVIPSMQVAFLWRLDATNAAEPDVAFFPLKMLIAKGMHPAGGVDTIGTQNFATNPFFSIARAVNRDSKYGTIVQPGEAIPVMDAIRMFTIWSAEANFLEKDMGSIEVGKLADFVVVDADPLTIPKARIGALNVDMTIMDGKIAYQRSRLR